MTIPITAREPIEFRPPALRETKPDVVITLRVPTIMERDAYAAALIRGGVMNYSRQQMRDLSFAGVEALFDASKHEEYIALLEELYLVSDEETRVEEMKQQRLLELHEAAKAKGETVKPKDVLKELDEIKPTVVMDRNRRIQAVGINQQIMSRYKPLQEALGAITEQDAKRAWLNNTLYVMGWKGLEHEPDGNGKGGITDHEAEYLRKQVGHDAWQEISNFITAMQTIDGDEEKNLALLLESESGPTGSTPSEQQSASSENGNSTDARSSRTRGRGSRKTTGSSSRSTKSSRTKTGGSTKSTRTGGR